MSSVVFSQERMGVGLVQDTVQGFFGFFCLDFTSVYPYSTSVLSDKEIRNKRLLLQTSRKHENMYTLEEISKTRKEIKTLQF